MRIRPNAAPSLIVLLATGLRAWRLGYQELRGDETFGYLFSQNPLPAMVRSTLELREPHPPGSYLVEGAWIRLAGDSEFALRFLSVWFGVLAVALLYALARTLKLPRRTAAVASLLLACSPYSVWHAQDARMYSMSLALTLASTLLAVRLWGGHGRKTWLAYVATSAAALFVHYFAVFVLLAQNLFLVRTRREPRRLRRWLTAQAAIALLVGPWLLAARDTLSGYGGNGDSPGFLAMSWRSLSVLLAGESLPSNVRILLAPVILLLVLLGIVRLAAAGGRFRLVGGFLAAYLALPLLMTWISSLARPIYNERYLIAAAPPLYLLLASAAGPLSTRDHDRLATLAGRIGLLVAGAALLVSLSAHYTDPAYSKTRGWRILAGALTRAGAGVPAPELAVVQNYPDPTLWYYYRSPALHVVMPPGPEDGSGARREVQRLSADGIRRVLLATGYAKGWDETGVTRAALLDVYELQRQEDVASWQLLTFGMDSVQTPSTPLTYPGGWHLAGSAVYPEMPQPGSYLSVRLAWEGDESGLQGDEKSSLQLIDPAGRLVTQDDRLFGVEQLHGQVDGYMLLLPVDLRPGAYRLVVAIYHAQQPGKRIPTLAGTDLGELGLLQIQAP